jgi:hypothetical protein
MNRNKLLVIFGVLFILIFIGCIFWIQTGLKGTPSETKFNFQIGFLQKIDISDDELLTEIVQPSILSIKNPIKNNTISFCSLNGISSNNSDALIAPILGMNYFRYNFMSKEMYSMEDRLNDEDDYFKNLKESGEFKQLITELNQNELSKQSIKIIEKIDGISSFLINPNYTGKKIGVFKSVKLVKDFIVKQTYLFEDEKPVVIKFYIDLNGPKTYNKSEERNVNPLEQIEEEEEEEVGKEDNKKPISTANDGKDNNLFKGVTLETDREFTWEGDASTIKIKISIPTLDISISKIVQKNHKIELSIDEKTKLLNVDDPDKNKIVIEYYNNVTKKFSTVNVIGVTKSIHCFNFF